MADWAHDWTDVEIERLKSKIERQFLIAKAEMAVKMEDYLEGFEKRRLEWLAKVEAGTETQEEYEAWLQRRYLDRAWYEDMIDMLTDAAVNADREAMAIIRDKIPEVFAENANYSAYSVEMGIGKNTHSFDLYDRDTVARLLVEDRRLLPPIPEPRLKELKDKIWNQQKFTSAVTQSILQGESIPNAAKRMMSVFDMDKNSAIRAARTSITGAENAGRVHSYRRAKEIGIDLEQEWLATLDLRTRHTHRLLDGKHVPVGGKFKTVNGTLEFPGDPEGPAEEVYNCRCTLVPWFPWMDEEKMPDRWSNLPDGMTYEEWKSEKKDEKNLKSGTEQVWSPKDIGTAPQRPRQENFESYDDYLAARQSYRKERRDFAVRKDALIEEIVGRPPHSLDTEEAVRQWADRVGVEVMDNVFNLIDPRVLDDAAYTLDSLIAKYPQVTESFARYGSKFRISVSNDRSVFMEASGGLAINPSTTSTYREAVKHVVEGYTNVTHNDAVGRDLLWQVRGEGTLRTVVTHEFGHNLDDAIKDGLSIDQVMEYQRELMDLTRAHTVSDYSMTNDLEAFAEGFAEYTCNPNSEYAEAFGKFLARWL